jgi:acetylornithine deacetylase/succinyl-diaminopimelate desuccinylase-like protein
MDWQSVIAIGALLVAGVSFLARSFDKSLSIREHEEFRNSIRDQLAQVRLDTRRDDDRLEDRIKVLETTRPTTGELEAKLTRGTPHHG